MAESNSYASPGWSLQDRQQQRQHQQHLDQWEANSSNALRRSYRGAYMNMGSHETDFLMASIVPEASPTVTADPPIAGAPQPGNVPPSPTSSKGILDVSSRRSASSVINMPNLDHFSARSAATAVETNDKVLEYGARDDDTNILDEENESMFRKLKQQASTSANAPGITTFCRPPSLMSQLPAIAIASLLNLMMAIPFGVSYFPIGWSSGNPMDAGDQQLEVDSDGVSGSFPLPGKEALGIRMCLFSTLVGKILCTPPSKPIKYAQAVRCLTEFLFSNLLGQIIMTFASRFDNCICFQMIVSKMHC